MDVCLVSMPYAAVERPSIALGLLSAELRAAGVDVQSRYACLDFAARVGLHAYDAVLASKTSLFIGEWTFAAAAFPEMAVVDPAYLATCGEEISGSRAAASGADPREILLRLREEASRFTAQLADQIVAQRPRIVGCTSTFQQQAASLALLRAVRERDPSIVTIIGGTNCESAMGMATRRAFPWVDFVVSGEADEIIVPFVRDVLARGRDIAPPPGVIDAAIAARVDIEPPRASVWSVDTIPTPDYDDYFTALDRSPLRELIMPALVVETSRGCWWGAKSHCTFCGLNGGNMAFRAKSPERAAQDFHRLAARYGVRRFTVVDNIIDMQYHQTMLPLLAGCGYDIFYETKANLRRHHMQSFSDAGVRSIQPGIESLHDEILHLLAKGNKAWMNVQLLKWAAELAMDISWVFLVDVPGQRDASYIEMLMWLPSVMHLPPPSFAVPIQFMRFSPYHRDAAKYGFDLVPEPAYAQVYPLGDEEMQQLAYEFVDRRAPSQEGIGQSLLLAWLGLWREAHRNGSRPVLEMRYDADAIELVDTRSCRAADRHRLEGDAARLYAACDEAVGRNELRERLGIDRFDEIADQLLADKVLLELSGRLLALAVDVTRPRPEGAPNPGGRIDWAAVTVS
ncbi:MAG TPA: RiPP maturation radical SAM C-methyltransferase [Thermoanaerobaculia bacterium]|jgi:magnesium-protoporphyrin IX monomethyl ester (oxidative) cyclase|nr:RiPP maturation radical SAM C-methyltransferase [Thermoanaerobaculia bacterium]